MGRTRCLASGCSGGYIRTYFLGNLTQRMCGVCRGTGWTAGREIREAPRPGKCPYGACGDKCRGKGHYDYMGHTIWCHL